MKLKNILKKYNEYMDYLIDLKDNGDLLAGGLCLVLLFLPFIIGLGLLLLLWLGFINLIGARAYVLLCIGGIIAFFVWIHKHEQTEEYKEHQTKKLKEHFDRTTESRAQLKSVLDKYHNPEK